VNGNVANPEIFELLAGSSGISVRTAPASTAFASTTNGGFVSLGLKEVLKMSNSSTTTEKWTPVHPGEVLMEDFINGFGITQNKLAVSIGVPPRRINEIVHGKRAITADTALRLGRYFDIDPQFWLNLQSHYELEMVQDRVAEQIAAIKPLKVA
jgi:addiction module HigA family antidote